jgi:hypothetical protein
MEDVKIFQYNALDHSALQRWGAINCGWPLPGEPPSSTVPADNAETKKA